MRLKYEFQKLFVTQHVEGEAVRGPAPIERFGLTMRKGVKAFINDQLCVG